MNGQKTYILAIIIIIYAVSSAYLGKITWDSAWAYVLSSGALSTLRSAIKKLEPLSK